MNEHDRDNLRFLLTASDETMKDWYTIADLEDIAYALELINSYQLQIQAFANDEVENCVEAISLLKKFTLNP
jgi:hypothetical protein